VSISERDPPKAAPPPRAGAPRRLGGLRRPLGLTLRIALVRLRFPLVLAAVLLLVGSWPALRARLDRLTGRERTPGAPISHDTEYWCPMCPGVVSEWPGKCPVCNMALVRRQKGEMTPLPDGVVARVQLSPYRVQLAGLRTAPAEYRPLEREALFTGFLEARELSRRPFAQVEGLGPLAAHASAGKVLELRADEAPGLTFPARVVDSSAGPGGAFRVRLAVDDPDRRLRPGWPVKARLALPAADLAGVRQSAAGDWRDKAVIELIAAALARPAGPAPGAGLRALVESSAGEALRARGLVLGVPESAVVDTGARQVVYVERMPGVFDGVEVTLGPRCGEHYPVLRGLRPGERVVTAGAFLLDAETRLNPAVAASYFGATGRSAPSPAGPAEADDATRIARQKVCPVTGEPLGSMGPPVRVTVEGRVIFLCCKGCEPELRRNPRKYLAKVPEK
jgi:membrane fusion protein, copper/silver efflux system